MYTGMIIVSLLQIWIIDIFIMTTNNIVGFDMQNVDETIVMNLDTTWS